MPLEAPWPPSVHAHTPPTSGPGLMWVVGSFPPKIVMPWRVYGVVLFHIQTAKFHSAKRQKCIPLNAVRGWVVLNNHSPSSLHDTLSWASEMMAAAIWQIGGCPFDKGPSAVLATIPVFPPSGCTKEPSVTVLLGWLWHFQSIRVILTYFTGPRWLLPTEEFLNLGV